MCLYETVLARLLDEIKSVDPKMIKPGLDIKNSDGFNYKVVEVDSADPDNLMYVIERPGWRSEPMTYKELEKFKRD